MVALLALAAAEDIMMFVLIADRDRVLNVIVCAYRQERMHYAQTDKGTHYTQTHINVPSYKNRKAYPHSPLLVSLIRSDH